MSDYNKLLALSDIPDEEKGAFDKLVKESRNNHISPTSDMVNLAFSKKTSLIHQLKEKKNATAVICSARGEAWEKFLVEEAEFNTFVIKEIGKRFATPRAIMERIIETNLDRDTNDKLIESVRGICGEYAGRISPYIYALSLSNTNSRRSRAGSTFQHILYKMYEILGYPYSSQKKVGRNIFQKKGLGKIVDSVLPGIEEFSKRRGKTIIGTMKTTLRERWQEVSEEIARTNIPNIFLLTMDDDISASKAEQMKEHNITIVVQKEIKEIPHLKEMRNIISFEEYFFEEIPQTLNYWK